MSRDQIDQGDHDRTRQRAIRKVKGKPFRERERERENLHSRVRVGQAGRPLPPKTLSILEGLTLKLLSLYDHN